MYNYYYAKIEEEVKSATKIFKSRTYANELYYMWRFENLNVTIINNSQYDLHYLRYNASWRWAARNQSKSYNNKLNLRAGQSFKFDPFGESVIEDARDSFTLIFDDAVHNILQKQITYNGDEYEKYLLFEQNSTSVDSLYNAKDCSKRIDSLRRDSLIRDSSSRK